ncbi:MAG TPA: threonine ammonia-lyase [Tepidisphaeraceae bacterium]|nr:threonine ammonia-lyase [Tepidisphaeraceae bacterium]
MASPLDLPVTLKDILAAHERIKDAIYRSPCPYSLQLSRLCGCRVFCKLDHLQITGSFKERGARNKLMLLNAEQRKLGVVAASAGNHALGLAYHAQLLEIPATMVMPKWAPLVKVSNCRGFGATVVLHGECYEDAKTLAQHLAEERKLTYIPGFDDRDIIAGQGTMGLEILQDVPDVDAVIVPIGGGGVISGIAVAVKSLKPDVRVIGVEPAYAPTMHESLRRGQLVRIDTQPTLADGLAVAEGGKLCFQIIQKLVDRVMLVDEGQIALSVLRLLELEKTVVEGAGAVPLAAAMDKSMGLAGKNVVLALCGGNIDVTTIARVIDRGLAADGRFCRVFARLLDRPGALANLAAVLASTGANIQEVSHDRHVGPADVARVVVVCSLETRDADHIAEIRKTLQNHSIDATVE